MRNTVLAAQGRAIRHVCLTRRDPNHSVPGALRAADDEAGVLAFLSTCHPTDTVVITPNNIIRGFSPAVRAHLDRLPILHMASGQLSFFLQDSEVLAHSSYINGYKVSRILCLSDMDMLLHRQMGLHELTKVRLPVATRSDNGYSPDKNRFVTYVGRIDFHAKGAERLVPIAKLMKARGLLRLRIFTTDGPNSPDLPAFLAQLSAAGVSDWVEITYNVTDKPKLYEEASVLLLPSKKESLGNVILEAFSFGVPVIAPSYAPGPAEVIRHGVDGFLLDEYSAEAVVDRLESLSPDTLVRLSQAAFARHQDYSMEQYLTSLETIAADTALTFSGRNEIRPYPVIKSIEMLTARLERTQLRLSLIKRTLSWRMTEPLRLIRAKLTWKSQP
ncbi:glycosyltransferase family 4 protein [Microvirga sp. VF16]|uniref:glycosyltransferase family 4 protein n=1 Tax=Microvirga sp. VF16 TaxID=2807101 RepID=UPI00193E48E9|nr:glycosyltransferase family 4 protein [Microvirga sp. VF16]QRM28269.1 glycosyltransferase family 4 protein [Microvirga sp. VF16]